ncbi:hypothetical protein [Flavobacterium beibuense]|uniref:Surface antigen (D15) n=1 Tax=Flavobacterium beibuense TaxID=657326 RepID=A0A444WEP0_9FLAO|nr:hypothetical protein [Flavobacterium beibuense]RYJ44236.1 Surface antigen (D15) [Flavobacterium beibuense]
MIPHYKYKTLNAAITLLLLLFAPGSEARGQGSTVSHTFYLTGNGGREGDSTVLEALGRSLEGQDENTSVLFLGNNAESKTAFPGTHRLDQQLSAVRDFKGKIVFVPGYDDWKKGVSGIKAQQEYINSRLSHKSFFPTDGCALKKIEINQHCDLLLIDSQWALMDWDDLPGLNRDCDLKTKEDFYAELEHEINKSEGRIVLIAMCHPVASGGRYGSSYSFGIDRRDIANKHYKEFSDRLLTMAQRFRDILFVAGHEQNLQFIHARGIPVVISGSARQGDKPRHAPDTGFVSGDRGFARITIYSDKAADVSFFDASNNFSVPVFSAPVLQPQKKEDTAGYGEYDTPAYVYRSVYSPEELRRSGVYRTLWGNHYRRDYITPVKLQTALLDTLYGGLRPVRHGGGHQTNSLRLADQGGKGYNLRGVKKDALRFMQYFIFSRDYLTADASDTYFVELLEDYWTTANPFAPLTAAGLSKAIGLPQAEPRLYFLPRQKALGSFNSDFGDAMYFLEPRTAGEQAGEATRQLKDRSTMDLIGILAGQHKVVIDESLYIRARLFDNVIGDFDRHHDQWRWREQKLPDGSLHFSPIPRDRDQAFADFDGMMIRVITALHPPLGFMQPYGPKYRHLRWFNDAGDDVDRVVLRYDTEQDWIRQARFIKEQLTGDLLKESFERMPQGVDRERQNKIMEALAARLAAIEDHAVALYRYIKSRPLVTGTNGPDHFIVTRNADGSTHILAYRMQGEEAGNILWDTELHKGVTREIRIYGLDGNDTFEVNGDAAGAIPITIIGGRDTDLYRARSPGHVRVFDYASEHSDFESPVRTTLSDSYELNTYNYKNAHRNVSAILPILGYNPDGGLGVGVGYSYTVNALRRNPYTARHIVKGRYFTATSGVAMDYQGEFAQVLGKANLGIKAGFTTPDYTCNFFGYGNRTPDYGEFDVAYNRVNQRLAYVAPSLIYRGYYGGTFTFGLGYSRSDIEKTEGTYIATAPISPMVFRGQEFYSVQAGYMYENFDEQALPGKGIAFGLSAFYTANFAENRGFACLIPEIRLTTKIDPQGTLIYATKLQGKLLLNNQFEFFQAATIGDGDGLRGLRQQRFSGKGSFYHNSDLRLGLGRLRNGILPMTFGLYGGFDYGRVWLEGEDSSKWHTSQGGGLFFTLAGFTTANLAYFNSADGNRINIALQLAF